MSVCEALFILSDVKTSLFSLLSSRVTRFLSACCPTPFTSLCHWVVSMAKPIGWTFHVSLRDPHEVEIGLDDANDHNDSK